MRAAAIFFFAMLAYLTAFAATPDNPYRERSESSKNYFLNLLPNYVKAYVKKASAELRLYYVL